MRGADPLVNRRAEVSLPSRPVLSHATDAVRADGLLFVAGVLPVDVEGRLVGAGAVIEQSEHVFGALGDVLDAGGCTYADVASMNVYLTVVDDRPQFDSVMRRVLGTTRPAGSLVEVTGLAIPGARVEIDAVAVIP